MALVASFAPSLRSGANDATRATNKQYALQKFSYCPINLKVVKAEKNLGILISSGHDLEGPHRHGGS